MTRRGVLWLAWLVLLTQPVLAERPLKIVYYHDFRPFSWDENGQAKGLFVDILNEVLVRRLGLNVVHECYPWQRAQEMVEKGLADAFCTVPTPQRLAYASMGHTKVMTLDFTLFVKATNPRLAELGQVKSLAGLKGFKLGTYIGSGWAKKNLEGLDVQYMARLENVLAMLDGDRFDGFIDVALAIRYYIHQMGLEGRIVELPQVFDSSEFCFMIGKRSPYEHILPKVGAALEDMSRDGTWQNIMDKYYKS
jgi:polar amino acid transport system substrate-binding protein